MADPISLAIGAGYLILSVVQVTNNAYRLIDSIKYSAPKVDQIYYRILAEKETTEAWANQMRIANGMDLQTSIPPDKLDEVTKLLSKLVQYVKTAEDKYAKVELKPADQKNTIANLRARAQFVLSGYDDLKDLVDVITSMNKALTTIAPPLPPYSRHVYAEGSTRHRSSASFQTIVDHHRRWYQWMELRLSRPPSLVLKQSKIRE